MAALVLVFAACEKEQVIEPNQKVCEVDKSVKGTAEIGTRLSLLIRQKKT